MKTTLLAALSFLQWVWAVRGRPQRPTRPSRSWESRSWFTTSRGWGHCQDSGTNWSARWARSARTSA